MNTNTWLNSLEIEYFIHLIDFYLAPPTTMTSFSASWVRLASSARLQRSSQILSISGSNALVFGGELIPRQPVDSQFDIIELGNASGKNS